MNKALDEGRRRVTEMRKSVGMSDDIAAWFPAGFENGAQWQREQEPTDAECIAILNAVTTPFGEKTQKGEWAYAAIRRCREAIMEARHKEYK